MRKNIILILIVFASQYTIAQHLDNGKMKRVLTQLSVVSLSANSLNSCFFPPADYVTDANGIITGENFYVYENTKYYLIDITLLPNNLIMLGPYEAMVKMNGDNISYIKANSLYLFEYNVITNEKGEVIEITNPRHPNEHFRIAKVEYLPDGRVSKISYGDGKSITTQKVFTYSGATVTSQLIKYKTGKGPNPKAIKEEFTSVYEKQGNQFLLNQNHFGKQTLVYNDADDIAQTRIEKDNRVEEIEYIYTSDRKLFRTVSITTANGVLTKKRIVVSFNRDDLPKSLPEHERIGGIYEFNEKGDLVWESRGGQYREKVNGVWSEWKYMRL